MAKAAVMGAVALVLLTAAAGVSSADDPADQATTQPGQRDAAYAAKPCGSRGLPACARGEFCSYPPDAQCGAADKPGTCKPKPEVCIELFKPVCGCDGKTYSNDCKAEAAGVSVAQEGECKPGGTTCGGITGAGCPGGQYCNYAIEAKCGAADQTGTCATRPQVCTRIFAPVCGCDGKTYGNDCEAAAAGVSVAAKGECAPPTTPTVCGGLAGARCPTGQYCNFPPDANCGRADATGACAAIPSVCTREFKPVCGCDGKTYGNRCNAAAAGVSVEYDGRCRPGRRPATGK